MSSIDPREQVESFQETYDGQIGKAFISGIGGVLTTGLIGLAVFVDELRQVLTEPLGELTDGVVEIFDAMVGGSAKIIQQGVDTAVTSIAPGAAWTVGPITFAISIGAVGLGLYAFIKVMEQRATADLIPFTGTDLPFIGVDEEGEDENN